MYDSIAPENYRDIPMAFNGKQTNIVAMARPDRGGHNINESMTFIKSQKVDVIISFDWKEQYKNAANTQGITYINQNIPDFEAPSFKQCDDIYKMVSKYTQEDTKVAMHCGAGHGRTGSVLAAIKLNELLDTNPSIVEQEKITSMVYVGHYGGNKFIPCTPLVQEAIASIRNAQDSKGSVEISKQIEMLCKYQEHLINQRNNKNNVNAVTTSSNGAIQEDHVLLKNVRKVVDIMETQVSNASFLDQIILKRQIRFLNNLSRNIVGEQNIDKSTRILNELVFSTLEINPKRIKNEEQREQLLNLKTVISSGEEIQRPTLKDKLMVFGVFIYKSISNFLKPADSLHSNTHPIVDNEQKQQSIQIESSTAPNIDPSRKSNNTVLDFSQKVNNTGPKDPIRSSHSVTNASLNTIQLDAISETHNNVMSKIITKEIKNSPCAQNGLKLMALLKTKAETEPSKYQDSTLSRFCETIAIYMARPMDQSALKSFNNEAKNLVSKHPELSEIDIYAKKMNITMINDAPKSPAGSKNETVHRPTRGC